MTTYAVNEIFFTSHHETETKIKPGEKEILKWEPLKDGTFQCNLCTINGNKLKDAYIWTFYNQAIRDQHGNITSLGKVLGTLGLQVDFYHCKFYLLASRENLERIGHLVTIEENEENRDESRGEKSQKRNAEFKNESPQKKSKIEETIRFPFSIQQPLNTQQAQRNFQKPSSVSPVLINAQPQKKTIEELLFEESLNGITPLPPELISSFENDHSSISPTVKNSSRRSRKNKNNNKNDVLPVALAAPLASASFNQERKKINNLFSDKRSIPVMQAAPFLNSMSSAAIPMTTIKVGDKIEVDGFKDVKWEAKNYNGVNVLLPLNIEKNKNFKNGLYDQLEKCSKKCSKNKVDEFSILKELLLLIGHERSDANKTNKSVNELAETILKLGDTPIYKLFWNILYQTYSYCIPQEIFQQLFPKWTMVKEVSLQKNIPIGFIPSVDDEAEKCNELIDGLVEAQLFNIRKASGNGALSNRILTLLRGADILKTEKELNEIKSQIESLLKMPLGENIDHQQLQDNLNYFFNGLKGNDTGDYFKNLGVTGRHSRTLIRSLYHTAITNFMANSTPQITPASQLQGSPLIQSTGTYSHLMNQKEDQEEKHNILNNSSLEDSSEMNPGRSLRRG